MSPTNKQARVKVYSVPNGIGPVPFASSDTPGRDTDLVSTFTGRVDQVGDFSVHSAFMSWSTTASSTRRPIFCQHKPGQLLWQYIMAYVHSPPGPPLLDFSSRPAGPSSRRIRRYFLPVNIRQQHHTITTYRRKPPQAAYVVCCLMCIRVSVQGLRMSSDSCRRLTDASSRRFFCGAEQQRE